MFPSLSQVSILNHYHHFKHDWSKGNLQKLFLPQEINTHTRGKGEKNILQTRPQLASSPTALPLLSSWMGQKVTTSALPQSSVLSELSISVSLTLSPYAAPQGKGNEHFPRGGSQHLFESLQYSLPGANTPQTVGGKSSHMGQCPPQQPNQVCTHQAKALCKSFTPPKQAQIIIPRMWWWIRSTSGMQRQSWTAEVI